MRETNKKTESKKRERDRKREGERRKEIGTEMERDWEE